MTGAFSTAAAQLSVAGHITSASAAFLMALLSTTVVGSAAAMLLDALDRCDRDAARGLRAGRGLGSAVADRPASQPR